MAWYQPRRLEGAIFGGKNAIADGDVLPKATTTTTTTPLFKVSPGPEEEDGLEPVHGASAQGSLLHHSHHRPFKAEIVSSQRLTSPGALKPTYAVRLRGEALRDWDWMPGDAFGILCQNDPEIVECALGRLQVDPEAVVQLALLAHEPHPPKDSFAEFWHQRTRKTIKLRDLFTNFLDLSYFPKKACLKDLSEWCRDPAEAQDLLYLSSRSGSPAYLKIAGERTTILDWLHTFPSAHPPLAFLLNHLPLLHPRFYSISNCKTGEGEEVEFVFNTIEYDTPDGLARKGICSSWLERKIMSQSRDVFILPRPNYAVFRPPADPAVPLVMICAGTGISPFIGFLRQFAQSKEAHPLRWLFFGFRDMNLDYLFADELNTFVKQQVLDRLTLAVSRQPDLGKPKYVQHALAEAKEEIWQLLEEHPETKVYICGDELTMIKDVNAVFAELIQRKLALEPKEANARLLEWSKSGRIVKDIWI
jgi:sulfite reductase alpha subunit-like flavoprotein